MLMIFARIYVDGIVEEGRNLKEFERIVLEMETIEVKNISVFQKKHRDYFLKNREQCTDLTFIVKGKKIRASRYGISAISEVFHGMLFGEFIESRKDEIEITDCEYPDAFEYLIEFAMTGYVKCPLEQAIPLLFLSEKYMIEEMKGVLSNKIVTMINEDNCFDIFRIARNFSGCDNLINQCQKYFLLNPSKTIFQKKNIGMISQEGFEELLLTVNDKKTRRVEGDEFQLFENILLWSKEKDEPNLKLFASPLILKYCNFRRFSVRDLFEMKKTEVLDHEVLLTMALAVQLKEIEAIKEKLPEENATLGTLPNSVAFRMSSPKMSECNSERDRLGGSVDLEHLKKSSSVDTNIHVPLKSTTRDGGACFDNKNSIWTIDREDDEGKKIYCTDLETNQSKPYTIPLKAGRSYPVFDEKRGRVYLFDQLGTKKDFGYICNKSGTFTKLTSSDFQLKDYSHRFIFEEKIWTQSYDGFLCHYNIEENTWKKFDGLKKFGKNGIAFFEFEGDLWIVHKGEGVFKYSDKKISEVWKYDIDFTDGGNFIFQSFLTANGVVFVTKGGGAKKWQLFDPINKTRTELDWCHAGAVDPGHFFIKSDTKEFYFNIRDKWRKVSLKVI